MSILRATRGGPGKVPSKRSHSMIQLCGSVFGRSEEGFAGFAGEPEEEVERATGCDEAGSAVRLSAEVAVVVVGVADHRVAEAVAGHRELDRHEGLVLFPELLAGRAAHRPRGPCRRRPAAAASQEVVDDQPLEGPAHDLAGVLEQLVLVPPFLARDP